MAPHKGNIDGDIKGVLIREVKLSNESFLIDVLGSKQKVLFIFDDMRHVVIGAIAPVADVDIFWTGLNGMAVNNGTKGTELIFMVDWLKEGIRI